jgi:hypothetical protein
MEHDELDRIIDSSFKMDPGYQLPAGFADRLVERWEKRTSRQANLKEYGLIVGTVVAILLVLVFTFYVLDREQLISGEFIWLSIGFLLVLFCFCSTLHCLPTGFCCPGFLLSGKIAPKK